MGLVVHQAIRYLLTWNDRCGQLELKPSPLVGLQRPLQAREMFDFTFD
jgi:hypothetical protein